MRKFFLSTFALVAGFMAIRLTAIATDTPYPKYTLMIAFAMLITSLTAAILAPKR